MMNSRTTVAAILLALAGVAASAAPAHADLKEVFSEKGSKSLPLKAGGVVFIESFVGSIRVTGTDGDKVQIETTRAIKAAPNTNISELRDRLNVVYDSTPDKLTIKSVGVANNRQVSARIDYEVKVPVSTSVNLIGGIGESFNVDQIEGRVYVRNVSGRIALDRVPAPIFVDSINADVIVTHRTAPTSGSDIKSTNGNVEIRVPEKSAVKWVAQTLKGDIMTGGLKALAGQLVESGGQKTYRAVLNAPNGPQLNAFSVAGRLYLLPTENPRTLAASVLPQEKIGPQQEDLGRDYRRIVTEILPQPPNARTFFIKKGRLEGNLDLTVHLGANVFFAQVEGNANVVSHGGEVVLGIVNGRCTVESSGGVINLGDVRGPIKATTAAGDVLVSAARSGGQIETGGGSIHVTYSGSGLSLESGGGDLTVRQAAGGVQARTDSGDIIVAVDPKPVDLAPIQLTTLGGNIVFESFASRGFDIDAEIEADAASANRIESAFSGLTTVREKSGNRVKIRARGQINGGGTSVVLRAKDGNIFVNRIPDNRVVIVQ